MAAAAAALVPEADHVPARAGVSLDLAAGAPSGSEYLLVMERARPPPWEPDVPRTDRSIRTTVLLM